MPFPDEAPLSEAQIREIDDLVIAEVEPVVAYIQSTRRAVIAPDVFLRLPAIEERVQCLIDDYAELWDLVPQPLFVARMNELVQHRDTLRKLEDQATQSGQFKPLTTLDFEVNSRGYLQLAIPRDLVEELILDAGLTNAEIAKLLGCGLRTIERRLSQWGIKRRDSTLSEDDLRQLIINFKNESGLSMGERAMEGMLKAMGHWAPRSLVREIIRETDPEGVQSRWRQAIKRRVYSVPFVNSLWHVDGHHKLIRWKIVVHGGIDGKTRLVVYLLVSDNNRAATVGAAFRIAAGEWGWPSRVRADWGGENVHIKAMMEEVRGLGRGSFLAGPSTHNQRIERLWRDVFTWTLQPFYALFTQMEQDGLLEVDNEVQLWALHFVFLPRINRALEVFVEVWNNHRVSTQRNKTPRELFLRGMLEARQLGFHLNPGVLPQPDDATDDDQPEIALHLHDFTRYGVETRGAQRERRSNDPHVQCDPPQQGFMTEEQVNWLTEAVNAIDDGEDFYGTEKYCRVLTLMAELAK